MLLLFVKGRIVKGRRRCHEIIVFIIKTDAGSLGRIVKRNKLFVGTKLIKNGTISMKVGTIAVR